MDEVIGFLESQIGAVERNISQLRDTISLKLREIDADTENVAIQIERVNNLRLAISELRSIGSQVGDVND